MAVRSVEYIISLRDKFSRILTGIDKNLLATGRRIQSIGRIMSLAVTLPIVALEATAVKLASDFEETESKFNTVFSSIREQATNTAKDLKNNFGLSGRAALQLLGDTGDLLVGFGFTESAALEMSRQVNELAVDLASFTNVQGGAKSASAALTKALLGERESIKTLGISILESDVKARVLLNTQKGLRFESVRQAKAVATLQLATEQSSKAIGDFERTSGSFANQLRISKARLEDLAISLGKILLPLALKLLKVIKGWIESFQALSPSTKKIIVIIAGLAAALGPVLFIIGKLITILPLLGTAITFATGPIGLIIIGIGLLVAGLVLAFKKFEGFRNIVNIIQSALIAFFEVLSRLVTFILSQLKPVFTSMIETFNKVGNTFVRIGGIIKDSLVKPFTEAKGIIATAFDFIIDKITGFFKFISKIPGVGKALNVFKNVFKKERLEFLKEEGKLIKSVAEPFKKLSKTAPKGAVQGLAAIAPQQAAGTRITSAAPKVFNITIDNLVETINNNVTNLKEGMNESKKVITEALLSALNDTQALVR